MPYFSNKSSCIFENLFMVEKVLLSYVARDVQSHCDANHSDGSLHTFVQVLSGGPTITEK
jgi:hypothetical protein